MATYVPYNPNTIITRAMFNFDVSGYPNFRLQGLVRISVSDGYGFEINWSSQQIQNIQNIFLQISQFANISFTNLVDYDFTSTSSIALPHDVGFYNLSDINIYFYYYDENTYGVSGGARNDNFNYVGSEGDVRINPNALRFEGNLSFSDESKVKQVLLHEILHSLGLSHPHYPTRDIVTNDFAALMSVGFQKLGFRINSPSDLYKEHFTIMSYDDQSYVSFQNAYTPMILDVIALQQAYGEGLGTHGAGDDRIIAGTVGYRTYFDIGGNDTVDGIFYSSGVYINLGQSIESASHLVGVVMSINDATTTIINGGSPSSLRWLYGEFENALGSSAGDFIIGSDASNILLGYGGNDFLDAGGGNDVVDGGSGDDLIVGGSGAGDDTYIGGLGVDTIRYTSATAGITVNLSTGVAISTAGGDAAGIGTDALSGIENVIGGNFNDTLIGSNDNNLLDGRDGNDTLSGYGGSNIFIGGGGNDTIAGGSRADVAVYSGNRSDYTVTTVAGVTTVRDNRTGSPDGTDTLRGMNILRFADMQLFQSTAANKITLAGQAQTFNVSNSEVVQGTNAAEQFIIAPKTSALVFAGNGDTVDLSGAINSYSFKTTGTQLQISDGTYTTTLSVGGTFTLRTASGSTSVAIDFAAGGAIKLGGTQIVGSATFDPLAAITNLTNVSSTTSPASSTTLTGTSAADTLSGSSGSVSVITGGGGNDTIAGGSRADVAVYSGNRSDYTVTTVAGVTTVRDNRTGSPDGTDTLRGMNILRFADMQLFQSTAANKITLAGQAQTFNVSNSEVVQGTNAAEQFIIAPKTSALVFAGNGDTVDLSGAINSYSFKTTGTQLQISDGTYTTTLSVGGTFTLRTASGSTSVAIDFAAGGAIKLGGTQIVGSATFDPLAAITDPANKANNASVPGASISAPGSFAAQGMPTLDDPLLQANHQDASLISLSSERDELFTFNIYDESIDAISYPASQTYGASSATIPATSSFILAIDSIENEITFAADYTPAPDAGLQFTSGDLNSSLFPESTVANHVWTDLRYNPEAINIASVASDYFDDKIAFRTSMTPDPINYVM